MLGIGADGTGVHELLESAPPGMLHQMQPHRHVVIKEPSGVGHVRPNASDLGGEVDDDIRTGLFVESFHVGFNREIAVLAARHDDPIVGHAPPAEHPDDGLTQKARASGHDDPFSR